MKLVLGIHNHQPIGNFDHVFADVFQKSYLPFLEVLEAHPAIRLCLHHSGPLWEWLERNRPEYMDRLAALVAGGRVEILGGAFYEPILPAIPEADRLGQIEMMSRAVRERFGTEVRGIWLAERVWEPQLAGSLAAAGIEYALLDDYHFIQAGLTEEELTTAPLLTEELGAQVALLPISEELRYLIPFREPDRTVALCRELHRRNPDGLLVMVDDGEKFGSWPDTYDWVYTRGWLDRFFTAVAREADWLELVTPGEALAACPPRRKVYLPPGSYFEMTEWALPVPAAERFTDLVTAAKEDGKWPELRSFLRGGFWRQFLQRYQESSLMYGRALLLHHDIAHARQAGTGGGIEEATRALWKAQCNCAYWHGVFGGLYLPHLRHAVYEQLIEGTAAIADCLPREGVSAVAVTGSPEWDLRLRNDRLDLFVCPGRGAACVVLEDGQARVNWQNTLRRRSEAYHRKIMKSGAPADGQAGAENEGNPSGKPSIHDRPQEVTDELRQALAVDPSCRFSLLDRLLHRDVDCDESLAAMADADGGDFAEAPYALVQPQRSLQRRGPAVRGWTAAGAAEIVCERAGNYRDREGASWPIFLRKRIALAGDTAGFEVGWQLCNEGESRVRFRFAPEWNLALLAQQTYLVAGEGEADLLAPGVLGERQELSLHVPLRGTFLGWRFAESCEIWVHEVNTVSQAESGFELNYQGHMLLPLWETDLAPGEECLYGLSFVLRHE